MGRMRLDSLTEVFTNICRRRLYRCLHVKHNKRINVVHIDKVGGPAVGAMLDSMLHLFGRIRYFNKEATEYQR